VKFTARHPGTNINVSPTHPLKEFAVLAGGLLAIAVGIYLALGLAVDLIVPRLSMDLEQKLAGAFIGKLAETEEVPRRHPVPSGPGGSPSGAAAPPCPIPLPFTFKPSDAVNAAALPGGHMVVFTGLLSEMTSENELVFVLAHELGHYAHRDHLRGLGRALVLMTASTMLLGADNSVNSMIGQGMVLSELSFSRRQETWADEFALETLFCQYGHVADAASFFSKIPEDDDPGRFRPLFRITPGKPAPYRPSERTGSIAGIPHRNPEPPAGRSRPRI
jgi:hypothetical protein